MRQQRASKELVKRDMLDPPRYLQRAEDRRVKALSFGVLDWQQLEKRKDSASEGTKDASSYTGSLELDLATGVVKRLDLDGRQDDVLGQCSSPVNIMEMNQKSSEKASLSVTSKRERHASPPNRRFSFSQMRRSFSSKESSSSGPVFSSASHASAKSGPLTFNNSAITKPNGHSRTRSGPVMKHKNVTLQDPSKPSNTRSHALLQFTLRKGISLYQFVVDNNVLAATMKSLDSSRKYYTLYSVKEVKNKSGNWLGRNRNDHPFVHTIIGQMKTNTDSATHRTESVLLSVETNEELAAAIVQTRNRSQKQNSTTTVILPSGSHTLPKDSNAPLKLIDRWESGGSCDCGGWDIGCKLRVLSNDHHTKCKPVSSFQLFGDQERDEPVFKMVRHDDELHSVEFGSSVSLLEAFFIALAVSSHQNWCEEEEEEAVLKRVTSTKYASNPPVSPIGRV
ncbi:hypothetical protein BRARA_D02312 [Brassica rapa]|uniref:Uncharacterized protein n=1 Tax=Brassica campestris TaxID=3711 RepID=A0A397ZNV3_BRACM|nr:hypothetical protein BRARA_D02312 [Brassica rapa]RID67222.1 hypothetical protein BRARA_D02312 [Brassica rapa]